MNYRVNDLENFAEAAGCRTMSEAASRLGMTQPSLSESIARLEKDLGESLFYRSRSGITLTSAGRVAVERARVALAAFDEIGGALKGSRRLVVGAHPVVAGYALPKALRSFARAVPDYRVELRHDLSRSILLEIQQGRVDVGLVVNPSSTPDLILKRIAEDEVAVFAARSCARDRVICDPSLIQTQDILRKWKKAPGLRTETSSLDLAVRLTAEGLGFGILPVRAVDLVGARLERESSLPSFRDSIYLVYRPEFGKNAIERRLIEALASSLD